jgi:hypothetical protein
MKKPKTDELTKRLLWYSNSPHRENIHARAFLADGAFYATNNHSAIRIRSGLEAERVTARLTDCNSLAYVDGSWKPEKSEQSCEQIAGFFPPTLRGCVTGSVKIPEWFAQFKKGTKDAVVGIRLRPEHPLTMSITDAPDGAEDCYWVQMPLLAELAGQAVRIYVLEREHRSALIVLPYDGSAYEDAPWVALIMPFREGGAPGSVVERV